MEWLKAMQQLYGCTEAHALDEIIMYKREMAFMHGQQGKPELARQLLIEIDEWDEDRERDFQQREERAKDLEVKLILPGQ